jgi:hypothetical protein
MRNYAAKLLSQRAEGSPVGFRGPTRSRMLRANKRQPGEHPHTPTKAELELDMQKMGTTVAADIIVRAATLLSADCYRYHARGNRDQQSRGPGPLDSGRRAST